MSKAKAVSSRKCSVGHCYAPETLCDLGYTLKECPNYLKSGGEAPEADSTSENTAPLPWTGAALGTDDVEFVAARSAPRMFGIIGPHNAGKTTLLVAWYLLLHRGYSVPGRQFAGSCTFGAWESLARWMRWPSNGGHGFPPHTSLSDLRQPGLLHLAFRKDDNVLEDVLFTDAPGEWFARWAVNRDEEAAAGARWTIEKSDAFAVVIDCEALAGPKRGTVRNQIFDLALRLSEEKGNRQVDVIWAKSDHKIEDGIRAAVESILKQRLPDARHFSVSMTGAGKPEGLELLTAPLISLLSKHAKLPRPSLELVPKSDLDSFLSYRGK